MASAVAYTRVTGVCVTVTKTDSVVAVQRGGALL